MRTFNPTAERPARAIQAWQILISKGMNRQTLTYEGLSALMYGKHAAGVLSQILGHLAFYCEDNHLPPLTTLVVAKGEGKPGDRIPVEPAKIDAERESVYHFDSYNLHTPSETDLAEAYRKHHNE